MSKSCHSYFQIFTPLLCFPLADSTGFTQVKDGELLILDQCSSHAARISEKHCCFTKQWWQKECPLWKFPLSNLAMSSHLISLVRLDNSGIAAFSSFPMMPTVGQLRFLAQCAKNHNCWSKVCTETFSKHLQEREGFRRLHSLPCSPHNKECLGR